MSSILLPHLAGLPEGIPTVPTPGFRKTQAVITDAVAHGTMVAVTGDAGLGKTFAVANAAAVSPLPAVRIQVGPRPSPKEVTARLHKALHGEFHSGTLYLLTDEIVEELVDRPRLVIIDEAQNLSKAGLDQVRLLHDLGVGGFPLVFVGGSGCASVLASDPQLGDRVGGWVRFAPLEGKHLYATLATYHPMFDAADRHLLAEVDRQWAHGRFRRWARFLQKALDLSNRAGTNGILTERVATAVLAVVMRGNDQ